MAFFQLVDVLLLFGSEGGGFPLTEKDGQAHLVQVVLEGKEFGKFQKFQFLYFLQNPLDELHLFQFEQALVPVGVRSLSTLTLCLLDVLDVLVE